MSLLLALNFNLFLNYCATIIIYCIIKNLFLKNLITWNSKYSCFTYISFLIFIIFCNLYYLLNVDYSILTFFRSYSWCRSSFIYSISSFAAFIRTSKNCLISYIIFLLILHDFEVTQLVFIFFIYSLLSIFIDFFLFLPECAVLSEVLVLYLRGLSLQISFYSLI